MSVPVWRKEKTLKLLELLGIDTNSKNLPVEVSVRIRAGERTRVVVTWHTVDKGEIAEQLTEIFEGVDFKREDDDDSRSVLQRASPPVRAGGPGS